MEDIERRVQHDLYYIDDWSIWLDLLILGKTVAVVVKGEKAH